MQTILLALVAGTFKLLLPVHWRLQVLVPDMGFGNSGGGLSTTGNGNITLIGTGPAISGAASNGVFIASGSTGVTTVNGAINIAGTMPGGTQPGVGVLLQATNSLKSTTGQINVSGTSSASGTNSHGVSVTGNWTTGTTGTVTFGSTISDGTVTITGCQGGVGLTNWGLSLQSLFSSSGNVTFLNCRGSTGLSPCGNCYSKLIFYIGRHYSDQYDSVRPWKWGK